MQLQWSTIAGCLVRCCCVPFLLCFFLLQSVVGIFLWLFGVVLLVSVLLSDFLASGWFRCLCVAAFFFLRVFGFFFRGLGWFLTPCCFFYSCITFSLSCGTCAYGFNV